MPEPGLAELQGWLQARVAGGVWALDERGRAEAEMRLVSSNLLTAEARLQIYARSYLLRLLECLKAEFPMLRALVGDQVFGLFAGGYLSARPSTSCSLYDLGAGFADYLEATRPRPHSGPGTPEALPASLARLERALADSSRAEGMEGLEFARFDPADLLMGADTGVFAPKTVKLLCLDFDFTETLMAAAAGRRPDPPPPARTLVGVARSRWRVRANPLEPWAFAWLQALLRTGEASAATAAAAEVVGAAPGAILARLLTWLPFAQEAGLVALRVPDSATF